MCPSSRVNLMTWATESFLPIDMADTVLKYGRFWRVCHESGRKSPGLRLSALQKRNAARWCFRIRNHPHNLNQFELLFHDSQLKVLSTHLRRACSRNVDTYRQKSQKPWPALLGNFCEIREECEEQPGKAAREVKIQSSLIQGSGGCYKCR